MNARFKDGLLLLLAGLIASVFGWAFWHFLGGAAIYVMMAMMIMVLVSNYRDRRRAKRRSTAQDTRK